MWSISALKERAKERNTKNRWKMILVALILTFVVGSNITLNYGVDWLTGDDASYQESSTVTELPAGPAISETMPDTGLFGWVFPATFGVTEILMVFFLISGIMLVAILLAMVIVLPINIFLVNPIVVGCKRFFYRNIREDAQVKEICFSFDNQYKNTIKIMFFRDLYTFLWTLLFIVPGIVKSYEYMLIPYILGEHPDMDKEQAFALSREMMRGNKWKAFLLDLSFLGWYILSAFTLGILGIFYVDPYSEQTHAMLYDAIKYEKFPQMMAGNTRETDPGQS